MIMTILAYFDPGSGSLLVQALAGGTAGLLVFGKYVWDVVVAQYGRHRGQTCDAHLESLSAASSGNMPIRHANLTASGLYTLGPKS